VLDLSSYLPFQFHFYQSGTAALSAALIASIQIKQDLTSDPEVILPAYACPDLISAIIYAGAVPILVDLIPNRPWMSLEQIDKEVTNNTVAIIAVRFLGIPERIAEIKKLCTEKRITLIEDSAQGFPISSYESYWQGDFNILSFGRGKPVNLLSGGAVLCNKPEFSKQLPMLGTEQPTMQSRIQYISKVYLYNILIHPIPYWMLSKLPGIQIGSTKYKILHGIKGISAIVTRYLIKNIRLYGQRTNVMSIYRQLFRETKLRHIIDLADATNYEFKDPLLRYPILAETKETRDAIYQNIESLGASTMYQKPLTEITGIPLSVKERNKSNYPNAKSFADRLITLPTHEDITVKIVQRIMNDILKR